MRSAAILQKLFGFVALNEKKPYQAKKHVAAATLRKRTINKMKVNITVMHRRVFLSRSTVCCCSFLSLIPWMGSGWFL